MPSDFEQCQATHMSILDRAVPVSRLLPPLRDLELLLKIFVPKLVRDQVDRVALQLPLLSRTGADGVELEGSRDIPDSGGPLWLLRYSPSRSEMSGVVARVPPVPRLWSSLSHWCDDGVSSCSLSLVVLGLVAQKPHLQSHHRRLIDCMNELTTWSCGQVWRETAWLAYWQ